MTSEREHPGDRPLYEWLRDRASMALRQENDQELHRRLHEAAQAVENSMDIARVVAPRLLQAEAVIRAVVVGEMSKAEELAGRYAVEHFSGGS